jgi:RNA polymerase sigma factor (TIGR02999 family)
MIEPYFRHEGGALPQDVTDLLVRWSDGHEDALDELMARVYEELRHLARIRMARERNGHTLQPTALAHEAFLRLCDQRRVRWQSRTQFFALASEMMRRVLVDHARRQAASKRGAGATRMTLEDAHSVSRPQSVDTLALHEALKQLEGLDARQARIVELRYFGGLTIEEAAEVLVVSSATVKRDWETARRWLYRELRG